VVQAGITRVVALKADPEREKRWELWKTRDVLNIANIDIHENEKL
jgi:hypothetical protein